MHLPDCKNGRYLMTPGNGDIDWAALFRKLDGFGYARAYTLALEYPGRSVDHHDAEYRRALAVVREAARSARAKR